MLYVTGDINWLNFRFPSIFKGNNQILATELQIDNMTATLSLSSTFVKSWKVVLEVLEVFRNISIAYWPQVQLWNHGIAIWKPLNRHYDFEALNWIMVGHTLPLVAPFTNMVERKSQHGKLITRPVKCWMRLLVHYQISTVAPFKFGNGWVISSHTLNWMYLLIHARITVKPWAFCSDEVYLFRLRKIGDYIVATYCKNELWCHFHIELFSIFWLSLDITKCVYDCLY